MARNEAFEQALRLVLETRGQQGVEAMRAAIADVGDVSAETVADTNRLLDSITELNDQAGKAAEFGRLSDELERTEQALTGAQTAAYQLTMQLNATEKPSRELQQAQRTARVEVERLEKAYASQWSSLIKVDRELADVGVNTANLAATQERLRNSIGSTSAQIERQAGAVEREAQAIAQLKQRMADGDEAFRKQAKASRDAGESLRAYRERAAAAERGSADLAKATERSVGVLGRLRGLIAPLTAYLSLQTAATGVKNLLGLGDAAELARTRLERLYGAGNGNRAFEQIRTLARDAGQQFDQMLEAALKLKSFGLEPLDGTLQGLIDQNALLGGSMESLNGLILGVGQAWAKQKLQGEEILQLVERGVPVWDLLAQATGKNVMELQRLSSAGSLGRDVIRQLLDEMARSADGAAADGINTLSRLWTALVDRVQGFARDVADSGSLDWFKQQLREIGATVDRLAASGELADYAKRVSDAIVAVGNAVRTGITWINQYSGALVLVAKTWAALRIVQWVGDLTRLRVKWIENATAALAFNGALDATQGRLGRVGAAIRAIPTNLKIGVALVGLEYAISNAAKLGEWLAAHSDAADDLRATSAALVEQMRAEGVERAKLAASLAQYRNTAVLTAEQVAKLSEDERASYEQRLAGLKQYLVAQYGFLLRQKEIGAATEQQLAQLQAMPAQLRAVHDGYAAIADGVRQAAQAMRANISPAAQAIVEQLKGIDRDAKSAGESIKKLFEDLNYGDSNRLGDIAQALASIAAQGAGADRNIRDGLLKTLESLSGEQLLRFQAAATAAFDAMKRSPAEVAAVLDMTLYAALDKLGVAADRMGTKFTVAGQQAIASFGAILENANATGQQIETAFRAALQRVSTTEDAQRLGTLLRAAGEQGKLGFDQAERAAAALEGRIRGITNAMSPLVDEFDALGIKSQASLNAAAQSARDAFEAIRRGAAEGKASVEDVRRALGAYAQSARAAVAESDESARARVESELEVLEAIYRVNGALEDMGDAGQVAAGGIEEGAARSAAALSGLADQADRTASSVSTLGDSMAGAGQASRATGSAVYQLGSAFGELSKAAAEAYSATNQIIKITGATPGGIHPITRVTRMIREQKEAFDAATASMREQLRAYDELAARREQLQEQYKYLGDSQIEEMLQLEQQLTQARQQRAEERRRELEEERAAAEAALAAWKEANAAGTGAAAASTRASAAPRETIRFELGGDSYEFQGEAGQIDQFSRMLTELQRSRAVSSRRGGP